MKSSVKVPVTKTWDLVQRHDLYSCPDTPRYEYIRGAKSLLFHSKRLNKSVVRFVDSEITTLPFQPNLVGIPKGLQARLHSYIANAILIRGILDASSHRFYFLWPDWLQSHVEHRSLENEAVLALWREKEFWFRWPAESSLLQSGWTRCQDGDRMDCYPYGAELKKRLKQKHLEPDGRNNGPAILSFLMAGGDRPISGDEGWPIHHIYDGQALIPHTKRKVLHAVRDGDHFTHSGGLVALHPAAHFIAHESNLLGWLLRWEAFCRFNYDPDKIF